MSLRLAVDIGGTFTDAALLDSSTGKIITTKTSSTPAEFAVGLTTALNRLRLDASTRFEDLTFASTVFINALITNSLGRAALLTTRGFRDVLELGRGNRPDMYNFMYQKPPVFIPRSLRLEVDERIDARGNVVTPLRDEDVRAVAETLRAHDVESVAVAFLHSYVNPRHEDRCRLLLEESLGPDVPIVTSSGVAALWLEYERTVSAAASAGLAPLARRVFGDLAHSVEGRVARTRAMKSNGGATSIERASAAPIHLVESGPAGGVIGTRAVGRRVGTDDLISFDVGGTTAKCALIAGGRIPYTLDYVLRPHDSYVAGYPLRTPTIDLAEIGAGGGSIAAVEVGGRLVVGPESAAADPGPIAYGRGGTQVTLTDACLLAGLISRDEFAGGEMQPAMGLVERAVAALAREWGRPVDETVAGVIALAQTKMANAVKLVSVKRGYDPRDFTLVAFGGGGPLHACAVADALGIEHVVVPRHPSVFSAIGMLFADVREDTVATWGVHVTPDIPAELTRRLAALEADAMTRLTELGVEQRSVSVEYSLDMRYVGQEHAVSVPLPRPDVPSEHLTSLFEAEHRRSYRFTTQDEVEVVHLRVVAWAPVDDAEATDAFAATMGSEVEPGVRAILVDGDRTPAQVYRRDAVVGDRIVGPAVIEESGTATIVLPGWSAEASATGDIRVKREVRADG